MKRKSFLATALLISGSLFFAACNNEEKRKKKPQPRSQQLINPKFTALKLNQEM